MSGRVQRFDAIVQEVSTAISRGFRAKWDPAVNSNRRQTTTGYLNADLDHPTCAELRPPLLRAARHAAVRARHSAGRATGTIAGGGGKRGRPISLRRVSGSGVGGSTPGDGSLLQDAPLPGARAGPPARRQGCPWSGAPGRGDAMPYAA